MYNESGQLRGVERGQSAYSAYGFSVRCVFGWESAVESGKQDIGGVSREVIAIVRRLG